MSRFTFEPIAPGEARDATVVGAAFDAFETASANVNEENLAEEGLTEKAFATGPVIVQAVTTVGASTPLTFLKPFAGTFGQFATMRGTAGALLSDEWFRILFNANLYFTPGAYTAGNDMRLQFRLTYANGGIGAGVKVPASEWRRHWKVASGPNDGFVSPPEQGVQATVLCEAWLAGPLNAGTWVQPEYLFTATNAGANVTVDNARMIVDRFKRVEVL